MSDLCCNDDHKFSPVKNTLPGLINRGPMRTKSFRHLVANIRIVFYPLEIPVMISCEAWHHNLVLEAIRPGWRERSWMCYPPRFPDETGRAAIHSSRLLADERSKRQQQHEPFIFGDFDELDRYFH
jgi:hypothetical protein